LSSVASPGVELFELELLELDDCAAAKGQGTSGAASSRASAIETGLAVKGTIMFDASSGV